MVNRWRISLFSTLLIGVLGLVSVSAAPLHQGGVNVPSPTPYPVDNLPYTLTTVGGQAETLFYPGLTQDGITISETSATSQYPRGMVFTVQARSENGDIQDVLFFIQLADGGQQRFLPTWHAETDTWTAHLWESGNNQPAWTPFKFFWRVRDSSQIAVETQPAAAIYSDPTRQWFRVETDNVIAYWFGIDSLTPETVAANITEAMAATEPRRVAGFGGPLGYKPLAVLYPTREALNEISGAGVTNPTAGGWTDSTLGMTILHFSARDETYAQQPDCYWFSTTHDPRSLEDRINETIYGGIPHEVTHLYQFKYGVISPSWWIEGEAQYFAYSSDKYWPVEDRVRHLASLQNIPPLSADRLSREINQADGCQYLNYDVGQSFVTWLVATYGIEAHAHIVDLQGHTKSLEEAVEQVTGKPFVDVENEWRAYIGFPQLTPEDLDPSLALEPYEDPVLKVGDTITLPPTAVATFLYEGPKPDALASGSCFANTPVEILRMGQLDGVAYFQVDCQGQIGWMTRDQLVQS